MDFNTRDINWKRAFELLMQRKSEEPLTVECLVDNLHSQITGETGTRTENRGLVVSGVYHMLCDHTKIKERLGRVLHEHQEERATRLGDKPHVQQVVQVAVKLYVELIRIHPFPSANFQVAGLILSYTLYRDGFPGFIPIHNGTFNSFETWTRGLEEALSPTKNMDGLVKFFNDACAYSLTNYENV